MLVGSLPTEAVGRPGGRLAECARCSLISCPSLRVPLASVRSPASQAEAGFTPSSLSSRSRSFSAHSTKIMQRRISKRDRFTLFHLTAPAAPPRPGVRLQVVLLEYVWPPMCGSTCRTVLRFMQHSCCQSVEKRKRCGRVGRRARKAVVRWSSPLRVGRHQQRRIDALRSLSSCAWETRLSSPHIAAL